MISTDPVLVKRFVDPWGVRHSLVEVGGETLDFIELDGKAADLLPDYRRKALDASHRNKEQKELYKVKRSFVQ